MKGEARDWDWDWDWGIRSRRRRLLLGMGLWMMRRGMCSLGRWLSRGFSLERKDKTGQVWLLYIPTSTWIVSIYCRLCTVTLKSVGFTNQKFSVSQSRPGLVSPKSKSRTSRGISFDISRMEICFPRHVREPRPNYACQSYVPSLWGGGKLSSCLPAYTYHSSLLASPGTPRPRSNAQAGTP